MIVTPNPIYKKRRSFTNLCRIFLKKEKRKSPIKYQSMVEFSLFRFWYPKIPWERGIWQSISRKKKENSRYLCIKSHQNAAELGLKVIDFTKKWAWDFKSNRRRTFGEGRIFFFSRASSFLCSGVYARGWFSKGHLRTSLPWLRAISILFSWNSFSNWASSRNGYYP